MAARRFNVRDWVVKDPERWRPNEFDGWGRGEGVGVVVEPPCYLEDEFTDVQWPAGRCFGEAAGLRPGAPH